MVALGAVLGLWLPFILRARVSAGEAARLGPTPPASPRGLPTSRALAEGPARSPPQGPGRVSNPGLGCWFRRAGAPALLLPPRRPPPLGCRWRAGLWAWGGPRGL